jgi:katanin p60 ATPase-containing subunit A1
MSALASMRVNTMVKDVEAAKAKERRRAALVLLLRYLHDNGYAESASALASESATHLGSVDAADNVSLERIFLELEEHHLAKHGTAPKLFRRVGAPLEMEDSRPASTGRGRGLGYDVASASGNGHNARAPATNPARAPARGASASSAKRRPERSPRDATPGAVDGLGLEGLSVSAAPTTAARSSAGGGPAGSGSCRAELPPLPSFGVPDLDELAATIRRDIFLDDPRVPWDSVAGLDNAKRLLKEAVVMPVRYPNLFVGLLAPWRGILLYGPPGTGKTMLAKAVATECQTTFFNVSASTVISKWRGDSEKLVRVLFDLARHYSPSAVFMDEIDALMGARGGGPGGEHEASRRMKTELLIQMDGLARGDAGVFVLAATNLPWELDLAMLRRLEKRVLVGLPDARAREIIVEKLLAPHAKEPGVSAREVAQATEGYSGSDVATLCKEMAMRPLRRLMASLDGGAGGRGRAGSTPSVGAITVEDARAAREVTKPSAVLNLPRYLEWSERYGEVG